MPVLNGKQTDPAGNRSAKLQRVVFDLVDGLGAPVRNVFVVATGAAVASEAEATLSSDGSWTITLPGHDGLSRSGTYWRRRAYHRDESASEATLVLPNTGGPYNEDDIAVDLGAVPAVPPLNESDYAKIVDPVTGIALSNNLLLVAIPGVTATVPVDTHAHLLHAHIEAQCATAGIYCAVYIAPVGSTVITSAIGRGSLRSHAVNEDASAEVWGRLDAGVGGEYGAFLSAASGVWQVTAEDFAPNDLHVLAI